MADLFLFLLLGAIAIVSAIQVVAGRNLFHSAMYLGLFLLLIAGFYFLLGADLIGIMQVFVYVGGVIVVLLFGIMLTSQMTNVRLIAAMEQRGFTLLAVGGLVALLVSVVSRASFVISKAKEADNSIDLVGKLFMTDYILPFEVISILLLAALIGAVIVARQEGKA